MNQFHRNLSALGCAVVILMGHTQAHAGFTFLSPTPYLSAADSPFDMSGLGTTFFLEDFEDFDVGSSIPGILDYYAGAAYGSSVDGDDGVIDGNGASGISAGGFPTGCSLTHCGLTTRFLFDEVALGKYPSHVGFAVTASNDLGFRVRVYDALGNSSTWDLSSFSFDPLTVEDDMFFGVISSMGITEIALDSAERRPPFPFQVGLRIDHLQYGVPEPSTLTTYLCSLLLVFLKRVPHKFLSR
jgi:hypothetical protein